jgi:hypothetical protein
MRARGHTPVTFHELGGAGGANRFHQAILGAKTGPYGAAVHAYEPGDYAGMRLFTTPDGKSGFALKGDDIVSVFKHPSETASGVGSTLMKLATEEGGRRLDAFDTTLPDLYSRSGFTAVARLKWNETYKPDGWDKATFKEFKGGEPDVVFMVYDPANTKPYIKGDGAYVKSYDEGTAAQTRALAAKADHPGEGYSASARVVNGVIHTDNVYDAVLALHEGRKVELNQPRQVSTLITKLGEVTRDMIAKGEKAPKFDLCLVTVKGSNLFCADTKGIPRIEMPQLKKGTEAAFQKYLEDKGHKVEQTEERAAFLRATQSELSGSAVARISTWLRNKPDHQSNPIFVSKDNYILDGHHRWAAKVGLDAADNILGNTTSIKIARVDASITQLLQHAEDFTGGAGKVTVDQEKVRALAWAQARARARELLAKVYNEADHPRDDHGKWEDAGGGGAPASAKIGGFDFRPGGPMPSQSGYLRVDKPRSGSGGYKQRDIELFVNPTTSTVKRVARESTSKTTLGKPELTVRAVRDAPGNIFVWRAEDAVHQEVANALIDDHNIRDTDSAQWWLHDGVLGGEFPKSGTGQHEVYVKQAKEWIAAGRANAEAASPSAKALLAQWQIVRARARLLAKFNPNHEPGGSPTGGQFSSGTGSGGGEGKPGGGKSKKPAKKEDFDKAKIEIGGSGNETREKDFLDKWNTKIGIEPEEFKKQFLGGVDASMTISSNMGTSKFNVSGQIPGVGKDKGLIIGNYDRDIYPDQHLAHSSYFKLSSTSTKHNIGKQMLAGNVAVYKQLGIDTVDVTANIDVGGYAWAKYGYVPLADSWDHLRMRLQQKVTGGRGAGADTSTGNEATSWSQLSSDRQDDVRDRWMNETHSKFMSSEERSWRESGKAKDDAKHNLAEEFTDNRITTGDIPAWINEAIDGARKYREGKGEPPIPFTNRQILDAMELTYESRNGEGEDDPDILFDDKMLHDALADPSQETLPGIEPPDLSKRLTQDMRVRLTRRMVAAFDKKAEENADDVEPPSYLAESVSEYQADYWNGKSDSDKLEHAINYNMADIPREPEERPQLELKPKEDPLLTALRDPDPKSIWKVADSERGKELLLKTGWKGKLYLNDPESMARFNEYVGRVSNA